VGRITSEPDGVTLHLQSLSDGSRSVVHAGAAVNCTGVALRMAENPPPVIHHLVTGGAARYDVHGIGIDTDLDGRVIGSTGKPTAGLYALGPLRKGTLWESTAIPEIRQQAAGLAVLVAADVAPEQIVQSVRGGRA